MNPLQGKGDAHIVVHILTQVQFGSIRDITLFKRGHDRKFKILETPVASDRNAAADFTGDLCSDSAVTDPRTHPDVRPKNLGIAEIFKELAVCVPLMEAHSRLQVNQTNYKGLQSYKKFLSLSILSVAISFSCQRIEQNLADSHEMRSNLDKFILLDVLQGFLKRELDCRRQDNLLV